MERCRQCRTPGRLHANRQALALRAGLGDRRSVALLLGQQAEIHQHRGNHARAISAYTQALELCREIGDRQRIGVVLNNMAVSHAELGERKQAVDLYREALQIRREFDDKDGLASTLLNLGSLRMDEDIAEARALLDEAHAIRHEMNDLRGLARITLAQGRLHEHADDLAQAHVSYEQAWQIACAPEVNDADIEAAALHNLAQLTLQQGDAAHALRLLEQAKCLVTASGMQAALGQIHYQCGIAYSALGRWGHALLSLATAQVIQERIDDREGLAATLAMAETVREQSGLQALVCDALGISIRLLTDVRDHSSRAKVRCLIDKLARIQRKLDQATQPTLSASAPPDDSSDQ
jgi:tetratricopeptide (TPR) repeat protein